MNRLWDFVEGVASGFVSAVSERSPVSSAARIVESCCQQLGWTIDERPNAHEMILHFNDPLIRRRKLLIVFGDAGTYAAFMVPSAVALPKADVPPVALGYLLERNYNPFVGWKASIDDDEVSFAVSYFALAAGLTPDVFKLICETLIREAYEYDVKMKQVGFLR